MTYLLNPTFLLMKIILENMDDIDNYLCIFYTPTCKVKPDSRAP